MTELISTVLSETDKTVEIKHYDYYNYYKNDYNSNVVIPGYVTYNGTTYSITSIGWDVFRDCSSFTSIVIPDGVTSLGISAFEGCAKIETLCISSAIESIGYKVFAGCEKIKEIKIGAEKPVKSTSDIFADAVYDNATLYVPTGAEPLYQKREPWNLFFYIVEMDFTGIDEVVDELKGESGTNGRRPEGLKAKMKGVCYDLSGRAVEDPASGIYIINGKKVLVK